MLNIEIQELVSKRNSDIDKLKNYLNSGKTSDEKVVCKTIEKIRHSEEMLLNLGYNQFDRVNDDGTFDVNDTEIYSNSSEDDDNTDNDAQSNNESEQIDNETTLKKTLEKNIKPKTERLGVSIKETIQNNLAILASKSCRNPNNVVNLMLKDMYDEDNNKFTIDFEKKERVKSTSYLVEAKYAKEIKKISKKTGLSQSDIFNILLETALNQYI